MKTATMGTLTHVGVLALSVVAAVTVWTREKAPKALAAGDVTVWTGHGDDVEHVSYESKTRKIVVDAHKDGEGRYFVGTFDRDATGAHGPDGGARPAAAHTSLGFVSVGSGEKLAEALGQLKALRDLGKIGDDRAGEFGLGDPEGTLTVKIAGVEHKLLVGTATPGGERPLRQGPRLGRGLRHQGRARPQPGVGRHPPPGARPPRLEGPGRRPAPRSPPGARRAISSGAARRASASGPTPRARRPTTRPWATG